MLAPQLSPDWQVFGSRTDQAGTPSPTVWSSADGSKWTAAPLDSFAAPGRALAAAQFKAVTVAVGSSGVGSNQQAAVWLSASVGGPFASETVPASDGPSMMNLVTAGSLGMFATGTVDGRFAMWESTNGRVWSELPRAEKVIEASPGARVNALLAVGDFVYAAGSTMSGTTTEAAVWTSSNGLDWHLVGSAGTSFSGPGDRVIYSMAALQTGLVAVGAVSDGSGWNPASWISPDGQSWSLPSLDFPGTPVPSGGAATFGPSGGTAVRSVSTVQTFAGAASVVAAGGGPYGQVAWQSTDGMHWTSMSLPTQDASATSWRAELTAATVSEALVLDGEPGQPYLLRYHEPATSTGGHPAAPGSWSQPSADPAQFGPVRPEAIPIALGTSQGSLQLEVEVVDRSQAIGPAVVSDELLSSPDGTTWTASKAPAALASPAGPTTLPVPGALTARLPGDWTAVDSPAGSDPVAWTSPDGRTWHPVSVFGHSPAGVSATPFGSALPPTTASGPNGPLSAAAATVNGLCTARLPATTTQPAHYVVAAVGSAAVTSPSTASGATTQTLAGGSSGATVATRSAVAWASSTGTTWHPGTVVPGAPPGATQSMAGCVAVGSGLVAYGSTTGTGGATQPALWRSTDGSTWSRLTVGAFTSGSPLPIVSLAQAKDVWLAAANPDPHADPLSAGAADAPGPAASSGGDAGVGPTPSVQDGRSGLWLSPDGGSAWQLIDTSRAPWMGADFSQIDLVGFAPAATAAGGAVHATPGSGPTTTRAPTSTASTPTASTPTASTPTASNPTASNPTASTSAASTPTASTSTSLTTGPAAAVGATLPVVVGVVDGRLALWVGTSP